MSSNRVHYGRVFWLHKYQTLHPPPFRYNCVSITPDFVTLARQTHPLPPKSKQLEMSSHSVSGCYEFPF